MKIKHFFSGIKSGFAEFGHSIGVIINSTLLTIVYAIGVGITSIAAKIAGKHFLDIHSKKKDSYWTDLHLKKKPIEHYYRQF